MTLRNYVVNYLINRINDADLKNIASKSELVQALCDIPVGNADEANEFTNQYLSQILEFISQFNLPDTITNNIMLRSYVLRHYTKIIIYSLDLPTSFDFNEKYLKNLLGILLK